MRDGRALKGVDTPPKRRAPLATLLGPAFVAAIAYVDPGNVAANLTAGAEYGYLLVWVLVLANMMAVLVQYLSAKLGLVTGQSLPKLIGNRLSRGNRLAFWGQAELVAAATDVAEVVGGAIALWILFGVPLLWGGVIVGVISMLLLVLQSQHRQRAFELLIMAFLAVIAVGFLAGLFVADVSWSQTAAGLRPRFADTNSVLLAASMLGATVMPHAIYLHSSLTIHRFGPQTERSLPRLLRATRWDVLVSLVIAGSVNMAMLLIAAAKLPGHTGTDTIEGAHAAITANLGPVVGVLFAVGLLASGLASTSVGSYAGAEIMDGLLHVRIPLVARRAVTLVPALILLATSIEPTWALVLSQVALSLGLPFALVPLVSLTSDRGLMGRFGNRTPMKIVAWLVVALIVALNLLLIVLIALGKG
jgi:manganese transport protein